MFALDRRGRGRSGDADAYALEREYEDVVAIVKSAFEAVNVLGYSYGGICALEAALRTDRIGKLILYEPPMGFLKSPPHVVDRLQALLEQGAREDLLGYFMQQVAGLARGSGRVAALAAGLSGTTRFGRHASARAPASSKCSVVSA